MNSLKKKLKISIQVQNKIKRPSLIGRFCSAYDDIKENTILKENIPVILQPYNDTWVRPW